MFLISYTSTISDHYTLERFTGLAWYSNACVLVICSVRIESDHA